MLPLFVSEVKVIVAWVESVKVTMACAYGPGNPEMAEFPVPML
jgi:hypothetical protein